MRKVIEEKTLYQFDELSDKAKETARDWFREGALYYGWWDSIYEDAATIGLKITSFDLGRSQAIDGILGVSVMECCSRIISNHGKNCGTYKLAERTFKEKRVGKTAEPEEFRRELLGEYFGMLEGEMDYLMSNESMDENIRANEYEFLENGKRG